MGIYIYLTCALLKEGREPKKRDNGTPAPQELGSGTISMARVKTLRVLFNMRKERVPDFNPGILFRLLAFILLSIFIGAILTVQDAGAAATYLACGLTTRS